MTAYVCWQTISLRSDSCCSRTSLGFKRTQSHTGAGWKALAITCLAFKLPWLWQSSSYAAVFPRLLTLLSCHCLSYVLAKAFLWQPGELIWGWSGWKKNPIKRCSSLPYSVASGPWYGQQNACIGNIKRSGNWAGRSDRGQSQPGTVGFGRVLCKCKSGGTFESCSHGNWKSVTFLKFYHWELCIYISISISLLIFVEKSKHH